MRKTAKEAVRQRKIYMVLIIILIIVLSALGGGYYLLSQKKANEQKNVEQNISSQTQAGVRHINTMIISAIICLWELTQEIR